jgi:hypothetical protein
MKINIGDQVRFLNDVGGGTVTGILGKDMVNVETTDGFEVPTYIKNLVVVNETASNEKEKSATKKAEEKKETIIDYREEPKRSTFSENNQIKGNDHPEFIFAFVPDNPINPSAGNISMFLINDCNFSLIYQFSVKTGDQYETLDSGSLEPNTKINLGTIQSQSIGELPAYCFQLIYFKRFSKQMEEPVQKEVAISPVKFFKPATFIKTNYFKVPSLIIKLVDNPLKAELEKLTEKDFQQIASVKEPKKITTPQLPFVELHEIDLHIEQLIDDLRGMNNADMLKIQMDTFRNEMNNAIQTGIKKVVFIHGVGDGVLKNELRRELQRKYGKYNFQDASFREYGFGATMVILKR